MTVNRFLNGVEFELDERPGLGCRFVLGIRKSGSSLLNSICMSLAEHNDWRFLDLAGKLFSAGVPVSEWQTNGDITDLLVEGNVYGGFRNAPLALRASPLFVESKKVLMVRDPRDALVSEYFSNAFSHSLPEEGSAREDMLDLRNSALSSDIRDYVLKMAPAFANTLNEYAPYLRDENCVIMKYEDYIFDKSKLIDVICDHFKWNVTALRKGQILSWADVRPTEEKPTEFIRNVTPGDHQKKLDSETIDELREILGPSSISFGYRL